MGYRNRVGQKALNDISATGIGIVILGLFLLDWSVIFLGSVLAIVSILLYKAVEYSKRKNREP